MELDCFRIGFRRDVASMLQFDLRLNANVLKFLGDILTPIVRVESPDGSALAAPGVGAEVVGDGREDLVEIGLPLDGRHQGKSRM